MSLADIVNEMDVYNQSGDVSDNLLGLGDDGKLFGLVGDEHTRQYGGGSYGRELVWSHVSQLSDDFIERYLGLDSETNNKFAELAEEKKELFESDDLPTIKRPEVYFNELDEEHGRLFLDILRNPKKVNYINQYCEMILKSTNTKPKDLTLNKYLRDNKLSNVIKFDFISGYPFEKLNKDINEQDKTKSMLYSLNEFISNKLILSMNLVPQRKRIVQNYIDNVKILGSNNPEDYRFYKYVINHNLEGKQVKTISKSAYNYYRNNFKIGGIFDKSSYNRNNIIESITFGLDKSLTNEFIGAYSLKEIRKKLICNYYNV